MAIAFKCDICGCFYVRNRNVFNRMELGKVTYNGSIEKNVVFDICPDCEKVIGGLIRKRRKNEATEKTDQESEGIAGEE